MIDVLEQGESGVSLSDLKLWCLSSELGVFYEPRGVQALVPVNDRLLQEVAVKCLQYVSVVKSPGQMPSQAGSTPL
ncbi:hypothetical protein NDU88_003084 [Pleurodeles waltl]|uniref:Uncharacterized protein n=1 Tax=Pleurodeles waltl TaxID=8319 RepID=A0AAV7W151_PLEWA|nr:hypothetical protein NDU88_003084 [Pleurodeles waltl]